MIVQIRVVVVVDVVAALASDSLGDAVRLVDSNKLGGSTNEGTNRLRTTVKKHDVLIWTAISLEIEAFAAIEAIEIDPDYCEVERGVYPGTDISYWRGHVRKDPEDSVVPYNLVFKVGSRAGTMSLPGPELPSLTGGRTGGGAKTS